MDQICNFFFGRYLLLTSSFFSADCIILFSCVFTIAIVSSSICINLSHIMDTADTARMKTCNKMFTYIYCLSISRGISYVRACHNSCILSYRGEVKHLFAWFRAFTHNKNTYYGIDVYLDTYYDIYEYTGYKQYSDVHFVHFSTVLLHKFAAKSLNKT